MPLTLHHGPAGPEKRAALARRLGDPSPSLPGAKTLLVTASRADVQRFKGIRLQAAGSSCLAGEVVLTFDDFLLKLVKRNFHRAHPADETLCACLIFSLAASTYPELLGPGENPLPAVRELLAFFTQIKKCGIGPAAAREKLGGRLVNDAALDLFADYQESLARIYHYDAGDLFLAVLRALEEKNFLGLENVGAVIFAGIYPLHAGHREILRRLKGARPDIDWRVFYDEAFDRPDDLLASAYEDLGAIADASEFHGSAGPRMVPYREFPTPYHEISRIAEDIAGTVRDGLDPALVTVALPDTYAPLMERALDRLGVPFSRIGRARVSGTLPPDRRLPGAATTWRDDFFAERKLLAANTLDRHRDNVRFALSLLPEPSRRAPEALERRFLDALEDELSFPLGDGKWGVTLRGFGSPDSHAAGKLFVAGLCLENLAVPENGDLYSPRLRARRDLAELLSFPEYRQRIAFAKLRNAVLDAAGAVSASRPLADLSGKPTTPLETEGFVLIAAVPAAEPPRPGKFPERDRNLSQNERKKFSVSELQAYLDCPYRYHAAHGLKLGARDRETLEPEGGLRGRLAHAAAQRWIGGHLGLYAEAIASDEARLRLEALLPELLREEAARDKDCAAFVPAALDNALERLNHALTFFLREEISLARDAKKNTRPAFCEWTLSGPDGAGLPLETPSGTIVVTGRADRVDADPENRQFSVIDYKTGEVPSLARIKSGKDLQSMLYPMAVARLLYPGFEPSAFLYYNLKEAKIQGLAVKDSADAGAAGSAYQRVKIEVWQDAAAAALKNAAAAAAGIRAGRFEPEPAEASLCRFCDYRSACGRRFTGEDDESNA